MYNTMYQYYDAIQPPETLLPRLLAMEPEPRRTPTPWRVVVPTAACLALMAVAAGLLLPPKQAEPVSLSQPTPQIIQQTAAPDAAETPAPEVEQTPELTSEVPWTETPTAPPMEPEAPEVSSSSEAMWPSIVKGEYVHTEQGDYLVFTDVETGVSETYDITAEMKDGYYHGYIQHPLIKPEVTLRVYDDPNAQYELEFEDIREYLDDDAEGIPIDDNGNPVDENGVPYDVDENGNPLDRNGVPIVPD